MAVVIGIDAKLWMAEETGVNQQTGAITFGTHVEATNVRNVTLNLTSSEADVTVRSNNGWRATIPTLKEASIDFEMVYDVSDSAFTTIREAYFNGKTVEVYVLDGGTSITTGTGLKAQVKVVNFTLNQPNEEAVTVNVSMKPTYGSLAPTWVTPPSGS